MSRRLKMLLGVSCAIFALSACGDRDEVADEVRGYIDNTRQSEYRFSYVETVIEVPALTDLTAGRVAEETLGQTTTREVTGVVLDDFRTAARLSVDGQPIRDEIIEDDLLAVRYLDGSAVQNDLDPAALAEVDLETSIDDIPVTDVLESQRWVVDKVGAPALTNARTLRNLGDDPLFDAFTILDYVELAIDQALTVRQYQEGALSQAYRESEDPFPVPDESRGIERFDLQRPRLPNGADLASGENAALAEARHFRKMAIYVKDGKIIEVREDLAPRGSQLRDTLNYLADATEAAGQDTSFIDQARASLDTLEPDAAVAELMTVVNFISEVSGGEGLQPRVMQFTILEADDEDLVVEVPEGDDVVTGNLAVLVNRGIKPGDTADDEPVAEPTVESPDGDASDAESGPADDPGDEPAGTAGDADPAAEPEPPPDGG